MNIYLVGGAVRDGLLGVSTKDLDYAVEIPEMVGESTEKGFALMNHYINEQNFTVFLESPEYLTTRAKFPADHPNKRMVGDFVLCREDGPYSDGRHPDWVKVGTLLDDQSRRDFTCNSIAMSDKGEIFDPFDGVKHTKQRKLVCVGSTRERFTEDSLRALRAIRFRVTKGFTWEPRSVKLSDRLWKEKDGIAEALASDWLPPLLASVSQERKREELEKCFKVNTLETLDILCHEISREMFEAIFSGGLRLEPTMKG